MDVGYIKYTGMSWDPERRGRGTENSHQIPRPANLMSESPGLTNQGEEGKKKAKCRDTDEVTQKICGVSSDREQKCGA